MKMSKEIISEKNLYRSADMPLVATINMFTPLWGIERPDNSGRAYFLFKREAGLDALVEGFWNGSLQVSPQAYFASLKAIKGRLYSDRRDEE
ncbi:MAG: DUF5659 domain-containing protein [bacterium]|nr:DUF5659 domain-containing protein [bacterium]